jgi:uncharacterized protein (TIGR02996 family)
VAREAPPQDHTITRAREEQPCATCGESIAEDELALSEAYVSTDGKWARSHRYARTPKRTEYSDDDSYRNNFESVNADLASRLHHLMCGATHQPYKLRSAMKLSGDAIPNRVVLEETIENTLSPKDAAERNPATRDEYTAFIRRLRLTDNDDDFLVFGDWLQTVGDPRGELIAVQHALETAVNEERAHLIDHEKKLLALHKFVPEQGTGTFRWRRGFVRRIVKPNNLRLDHPSFTFAECVDSEEPEPVAAPKKPAQPKRATAEWRVRHTRRPEWGIGIVVDETDAGREVEFEHGGKRVVKNVELLEDVDET